ncbi:MAG: LuxR C-terminal-related transcriptional regulator [Sedimentisphaerales bacterium]|nr:LuxR C-terminal-related transcriptional regulator [Sedimentisphaerales bacterium]
METVIQLTNGSGKLPDVVLIAEDKWRHIQKSYGMTERELQIARSVCRGFSNQQIANDLKIQEGTVKTHMRNIYRKTWVNNKIAMLLRFVEAVNTLPSPSLGEQVTAQQDIQAGAS